MPGSCLWTPSPWFLTTSTRSSPSSLLPLHLSTFLRDSPWVRLHLAPVHPGLNPLPLLFSLYTHLISDDPSVTLLKFAGDTAAISLSYNLELKTLGEAPPLLVNRVFPHLRGPEVV